jgi:SSS family solute:Na+ symporter
LLKASTDYAKKKFEDVSRTDRSSCFFLYACHFCSDGIYTIRLVKSSQDFSIGQRKASWAVVSGTIMGTLVGGASTIRTAQLAFQYGFSAWWFTLGAGIVCFVLGVLFLPKLYRSGSATIPQLLCRRYNQNIGAVSAIFSSLGIFMNIIAQGLSAFALITSIIPMSPILAAGACFFLVLMYLYWGGIWSTGFLGIAKILFLFAVTILCWAFAFQMLGGVPGIRLAFDSFPWLSLFGRGVNTDLAAGFSLIVGVLST